MKGYCECGCGQKTRMALQTDKKKKWAKGEPLRFIKGHFVPTSKMGNKHPNWKGGYSYYSARHPMIRMPYHHRAGQNGYVFEHIVIVEKVMGKLLPKNIQIHHHSPNQLVVCPDQKYHQLLHRRMKSLIGCGHANWIKCPYCQEWDDPINLYVRADGIQGWHRHCHTMNAYKNKLIKKEIKNANL